MSADVPSIQQMLVPDSYVFTDALNGKNHYAIVIHKTGDTGQTPTAQQVASFFRGPDNTKSMRSVHYVIDKLGTVVQCVRETDGAGGNCCLESGYDPFWNNAPTRSNLNLCTFSIEHCSGTPNGDNSDIITYAQAQSSFKLVAYLCEKYGIPSTHVKGHNSIAPQSRANCPGTYPMDQLIAYLNRPINVTVSYATINAIKQQITSLQKLVDTL